MGPNTTLIKLLIIAFFVSGLLISVLSIVYEYSVGALFGTSLLFWGAVIFFLRPEEGFGSSFFSSLLSSQNSINKKIISKMGYAGKPIYFSGNRPENKDGFNVFIAEDENHSFELEKVLSKKNSMFLNDPRGIVIPAPGSQIAVILEQHLVRKNTKIDLSSVINDIPKVIKNLNFARHVVIKPHQNYFLVKIEKSIFSKSKNSSFESCDLLCSAITCLLAKFIQKPLQVKHVSISEFEQVIDATIQPLSEISLTIGSPVQKEQLHLYTKLSKSIFVSLLLMFCGSSILAGLLYIIWNDLSYWGKEFSVILFGSRSNELLSLGLDFKLIHYLLFSFILIIAGFATYLYIKRNKKMKNN